MKKRLPLILAVSGILIIIAVAAVVYELHFGAQAVKEAGTPLLGPVVSQSRSSPRPQNTPGLEKTGQAIPTGTLQGVNEKTVPFTAYGYNAKDRRDPFATLIQKPEGERKKGSDQLQNYDVAELKLTGILWSNSEFYAVVLAPDGKSYIVGQGRKIGLHGGNVYKITKDSVIVRELLKDYRGTIKPKDTDLKLRREEEA